MSTFIFTAFFLTSLYCRMLATAQIVNEWLFAYYRFTTFTHLKPVSYGYYAPLTGANAFSDGIPRAHCIAHTASLLRTSMRLKMAADAHLNNFLLFTKHSQETTHPQR